MTSVAFNSILKRSPFEPFRVVMSSGESYNVFHPETAFVTPGEMILSLPEPGHSDGYRLVFCSYLHIAHVEQLKATRIPG